MPQDQIHLKPISSSETELLQKIQSTFYYKTLRRVIMNRSKFRNNSDVARSIANLSD